MTISDENIREQRLLCRDMFNRVLDHAWLKKTDLHYNESEKTLIIKLRRHDKKSKAKKKFLRFTIWINTIPPNIESILTIRDIESCNIQDKDRSSSEVILGGITFDNNEIYIGAFCEYEEPYNIMLKVNKINVTLEDV